MKPVLLQIPGTSLKLFGFGVMLMLSFLGCWALGLWRARREKLDPEAVDDLALWVCLLGLAGARIFYIWENWGHQQFRGVGDLFKVWEGGISFYGSVNGGVIAILGCWWFRRFPLLPMLDLVAPCVAFGIALGRIGCFLNGCCFGDVCALPWAVRFPRGSIPWDDHLRAGWIASDAARSLPVHPTQLYMAFDGLLLLGLLSAFYPLRRRDGEVMALLMVTYPVSRFLIERLRDDDVAALAGLTRAQVVSVTLLGVGLAFWAYLLRKPQGRYADGVPLAAVAA